MKAAWRPWRDAFAAPSFKLLLERAALCSDCPEGDANRFYAATAPTKGLLWLLEAAASRLQGKGSGVVLVKAGRGWGKTHALATVAHAASGRGASRAPEALRRPVEAIARSRAAVAVFDGSSTSYRDIARDYGLASAWSLVVLRLAEAAGVRPPLDLNGPPPGAAALASLLSSIERRGLRPVIIIDDADRYIEGVEGAAAGQHGEVDAARARREAHHFLSFLSALAEAVSSSRVSLLIVSTTRGSPASGRVAEALGEAVESPDPVEPGELGAVLKARLFEAVDPGAAARVVEAYTSLSRRTGLEGLPESYPLHPLLVEALASLVAGSPSHRGAASALGAAWRAVGRAVKRGGGRDYVLPGDLDALDPLDLEAILPRGSGGLEGLRAAAERDAEAVARVEERLRRRGLGGLASGLYAHLLLWSAAGKPVNRLVAAAGVASPVRGVSLEDALEALDELEEEAVHIHYASVGGMKHYIVKSKVNLEALVRREARRLLASRKEEALALVKNFLARLIGRVEAPVEIVVWPREPPGPGRPLRLVLLGPEGPSASEVVEAARPRVNTVVVMEASRDRLGEALEAAAALAAVRGLLASGELGGDDREDAERLESLLEARLKEALALAYNKVKYPVPGGLGETQLSLEKTLSSGLWAAAREALARAGKLAYDRLDPHLIERILVERGEASLGELAEELARNPGMPLVLRPLEAIEAAARRLVAAGRAAVAGVEAPCSSDPGPLTSESRLLSCQEAAARGLCERRGGSCMQPRAENGNVERPETPAPGSSGDGSGGYSVVVGRVQPREVARLLASKAGEFRVERLRLSLRGSGVQGVAAVRAVLEASSTLGGRAAASVRVEAASGSAKAVVEARGDPLDVAATLRGVWALGEIAGVEAFVEVEGLGIEASRLGEALARSPLRLYRSPPVHVEAYVEVKREALEGRKAK